MRIAAELDTQLEVSRKLGYVSADIFASMDERINSIGAKISGLMSHLRRNER
jgi:four helix bundle protein